MKTTSLPLAFLVMTLGIAGASPLAESTVTEVVKDVSVLHDTGASPAKLNDIVKAPERIRTGAESRAELTAPDQTITRVGANTVFSFSGGDRTLNLEKGSLLFHSPAGKGGGTIKSGGASAAVLGTTIIVVATADGGFKLIVLEGKGKATLPDGKSVNLKAGQLVFVLAGGKGFSKVLDINLGKLVGGSLLVTGFSHTLSSLPLIQAAIEKQNKEIAKGRAEDTGISPDKFASLPKIGNGANALDNNTYITFALPFTFKDLQGQSGNGSDLGVLFPLQTQLQNQFSLPKLR